MKISVFMPLLVACLLLSGIQAVAFDPASEGKCQAGAGQPQDSGGACVEADGNTSPAAPEGSLLLLLPLQGNGDAREPGRATAEQAGQSKKLQENTVIYFFWGKGCPHCEEERSFLDGLKRAHPSLEIRDYEVWYSRENALVMAAMLRKHGEGSSGVPVTFIHDRVFSGFTPRSRVAMENAVTECLQLPCGDPGKGPDQRAPTETGPSSTITPAPAVETESPINIPFLGPLNVRNSSLPVLTLIIAGMDSFNPCAFFVLLTLLGLLLHARSRNKMLMIGGVFVFFSGLVYFLFMAAWLNLFLVMGHVEAITMIAGCVSVVIAAINIKDFFLFKQGISLTIADSAKPKLFDRMRKLLRSDSLVSLLVGATVLAIVANFYELLCTAGFPMVFTRILTLNNLSTTAYYLYLVLYNVVYVVPLFIIVLGFTFTLGKRQLSEWQGRVLKLVSGAMMLGLGGVLLVNPVLLNNLMATFIILVASLGSALLVAAVTHGKLRTGDH